MKICYFFPGGYVCKMFQQFLPRDLRKKEETYFHFTGVESLLKVSYLEIKNPVYVVLQNAFIVLSDQILEILHCGKFQAFAKP